MNEDIDNENGDGQSLLCRYLIKVSALFYHNQTTYSLWNQEH